ncbi:unnamed protein product [Coffea canephora]|uniref:NADP-dependent oxidoreductase domain-containing protein n=1 Tax=Coffea canephora TaxID=49390 RepID=A0A068V9H1_COFCA|nr:unnamed protein product [Coffea canephora]
MASLPPVLSIPRFGSVEKPEPDMIELIRYAGDSGVTFLHTSDVYGPHMNEILIGKCCPGFKKMLYFSFEMAVASGNGFSMGGFFF